MAEEAVAEGTDVATEPLCSDEGLIRVLGHRGFGWNSEENPYPENTVLSALAALEAGAVGSEIDVTKTADDVVVLAHENALHFKNIHGRSKTDCAGHITKSLWADIEHCQALSYMEDGFEEPLNRIEELFAAAPDALFVIDVKNDQIDKEPWLTVYRIYLAALESGTTDNLVLMLYEAETIRFALSLGLKSCLKIHFREDRTDEEIAQEVAASGAWGLCAYSKLLTKELLQEHHLRGLEVSTYYLGVNISDASFDKNLANWLSWGLHSIVTDRIGRARYLMDQAACGHFP